MKTLIQFLLATFTILACVCCKTAKEEKTDDKLNEITFADPTIFVEMASIISQVRAIENLMDLL